MKKTPLILVLALAVVSSASAQVMEISVDSDPQMAEGRRHLENGHYRRAIAAYTGALKDGVSPYNTGVAHSNLCIAYTATKVWQKAQEHCNQAVAIDPTNWRFLNNRANLFFHMGQLGEAQKIYRQALELDPQSDILLRNVKLVSDLMRRGNVTLPPSGRDGGGRDGFPMIPG